MGAEPDRPGSPGCHAGGPSTRVASEGLHVTEPQAPGKKPFLYVVVCAAGVADSVGKLITAAQEANW
ncbi:flavoprotein, partial [Streptomyces sp. NPDC005071]